MKRLKILSFILSAVMLFSVIPMGIFAEEAVDPAELFNDPEMQVLSALEIFDKGEAVQNASLPMKRNVFAKLAIKLRGWEDLATAESSKKYFYDVDKDDALASYIQAAASSGLVSAREIGYFVPEANVTRVEAAHTMLNILGYDAYLKIKGVTDENIIAIAAEKGILKGVKSNDSEFSSYDIYTMVKNSLNIDVLYASSVGTDVGYSKDKDLNLLSAYHNVYEDYGVINANQNTGLESISQSSAKGKIKIDGVLFELNGIDYSDMLGHQISYFYEQGEEESDKILLYAEDRKTNVLTLTADDISDFDNMKYYYYDENYDIQKASAKGALIIYNDTAVEGYDFNYIPENGDVTLIDNNDDDTYDVVMINDYEDSVVTMTDLENNTVYLKTMPAINLDKEKYARIVNGSTGRMIGIKGFRRGSTVSVAKGVHGNITKIIEYHSYVIGSVTEISDNDGLEISIDGKAYKVGSSFDGLVENGIVDDIALNSTGRFYTNHLGRIIYWEKTSTTYMEGKGGWEYAILDGVESEKLFSDGYKARFYTVANDFEIFRVDDRLVVDGVAVTDKQKIYDAFCYEGENGVKKAEPVKQVMRIKRNAAGELIEIDRVGDADSGGVFLYYGGSARWHKNAYCFEEKGVVDLETAVIYCPLTADGKPDTSDKANMEYSSYHNLADWKSYDISIYKSDPNSVAAEACLIGAAAVTPSLGYGVPFYMLLDVVKALNTDGTEQTKLIYAKDNGDPLSSFLSENVDLNAIPLDDGSTYSLKIGDAFRMYEFGKEITYIQPIFDSTNKCLPNDATGSYQMVNGAWAKYGYVKKIDGDKVLCGYNEPGTPDSEEFTLVIEPSDMWQYDSKKNVLVSTDIKQITDYVSTGEACTRLLINLRDSFQTIQVIVFN